MYDVTNILSDIGIKNLSLKSDEKYLVRYDILKSEVEVYNTEGFEGEDGIKHYTLTDLENISL